MKKDEILAHKDYLRRSKQSSPESKLDWLAAALEFANVKKRIVKNSN
ncbi:MAG: hypothetical protein AAB373_04565 [Patescibacteria group bacterium]